MASKQTGIGLYEFLIESELQQYYNSIKNDLKVQNVSQLKYVSDEDLSQIGMSRPEIRRLKKFFQKHCPQTYLAKMKKKLRFRKEDGISVASLSNYSPNAPGKMTKSIAPGRHIIQAESIVIHKILGSGEFGTVQQGVWTADDGSRTQVAIKCLSQERMENNPVEFLKEAAIMHSVDHEHVVRLYGVVLDTSALMLVTELAPLRSLLECLKEPSMRPNLGVPTLYDFAVQICDGMQYLESKRLIHRDLASRNILVFSRNKVKISDFGLSRALGVGKDYYQTNFNVNLKLPIAWCAPESINFLRFTSASDVWGYAVTLWEMFSYGFGPWLGMSGQQILEAIDEPNYQRLEKPECCPNDIYYQIMLKCWQHDPLNRPTFAQLSNLVLEYKPEQVQAIRESEPKPPRDSLHLSYDAGDIITVLDRKPLQTSDETILWKGVLKCGKSGLFNPGNTITYLGSSLPSVKSQSPFHRNDSRSSSMRKGRISADMISGPQGDLKHTGHVGPDGNFFGDITFLGSKVWLPRQVVPPYKPESSSWDVAGGSSAQGSRALSLSQQSSSSSSSSRIVKESQQDISSSDTVPLLSCAQMSTDSSSNNVGGKIGGASSSTSSRRRHNMVVSIPTSNYNEEGEDHEYHEISDEENEIIGAMGGLRESAVGLSNPALSSKSQSPLDSPRFEKFSDFDLGPSLIDEVFSALHDSHQQPHEAHNVKNELREMARSKKKKFVTVKPISSSDRRTLDHAIAIANELASRSMLDLDRSGKNGRTNNSLDDLSSPTTPTSPSHRRKFSFILGAGKNDRERRNYSQEAASIPDIQSTLTDEAKEAYNSLVEKPSMNTLGFLTPSYENKSMSFHFPEKCSSLSKKAEFFLEQDAGSNNVFHSPQQSLTEISSSSMGTSSAVDTNGGCSSTSSNSNNLSGNSNSTIKSHHHHQHSRSRSLTKSEIEEESTPIANNSEVVVEDDEVDGNPLRLLRQNKQAMMTNILPLPPRKAGNQSTLSTRHQRKHPLLIPNRISSLPSTDYSSSSVPSTSTTSATPPVAPPKPQRLINTNNNNSNPIQTSNSPSDSQTSKNKTAATTEIVHDNPTTGESSMSSQQQAQPQQKPVQLSHQPETNETTASSSVSNCLESDHSTQQLNKPSETPLHNSYEQNKENQNKLAFTSFGRENQNIVNKNATRRAQGQVLLYENLNQDSNTADVQIESSAASKNMSSISNSNSNNNNNYLEDCATTTTTNETDVTENVPLLSSSSRPSSESSIVSSSSSSLISHFNRISLTATGNLNHTATVSSGFSGRGDKKCQNPAVKNDLFLTNGSSSENQVENNTNNNSINGQEKRISSQSSITSSSNTNSAEPSTSSQYNEPVSLNTRKIAPGNSIKIKTLQRILGASASDMDCDWALQATNGDSAHAVKLLRLKSLLPDYLITEDASELLSVLEMSFYDVARACSFILAKNSPNSPPGSKSKLTNLRDKLRTTSSYSSVDSASSFRQDTVSNTGDQNVHNKSYIRPTHV